jgi:hypothetical protein
VKGRYLEIAGTFDSPGAGHGAKLQQPLNLYNSILLKNPKNASTRLSMNGKSPKILTTPPFVLRFSKDERRVFQQNHNSGLTLLHREGENKLYAPRFI